MLLTDKQIERVKNILLEKDVPFFDDSEIQFYVNENGGDVDSAIYQMLIIKSEDTTLSVSGLNTTSTSSYFKRLAQRYRPNNSGTLR